MSSHMKEELGILDLCTVILFIPVYLVLRRELTHLQWLAYSRRQFRCLFDGLSCRLPDLLAFVGSLVSRLSRAVSFISP